MKQQAKIMGILNATPDSFSDGGLWMHDAALDTRIDQLIEEGADIIDVGGESTRPYATPVSAEEELKRVIPVIRKIRERSGIDISIDTTKAVVARAALAAGATMINDISALRNDTQMIDVVRDFDGPVVVMHMQGTPGDMQDKPAYDDVVAEINLFFAERIAWLERHGVGRNRIILDPGVGFGKTLEHNMRILQNIKRFKQHSCQVLVGHSRKSFLGQLLGLAVTERDCPTAILSALCQQQKVDILRVHNVALSRQALLLAASLNADCIDSPS